MKRFLTGVAGFALLATGGGAALAETPQETAELFGARQTVRDVSLSPDGNSLAYITPFGAQGEALYVVDLTGAQPVPVQAATLNRERTDLSSCDWATDTRLVCRTFNIIDSALLGELLGTTGVFAVNSDGSDVEVLSQQENSRTIINSLSGGALVALDIKGEPNKILMTRDYYPENGANTRLANKDQGRGVVELDIRNGRASKVENPDRYTFRYIADDSGAVRIKGVHRYDSSGNLADERVYFYRKPGSSNWEELSRTKVGAQRETGFRPSAVDAATNYVYGFDDNGAGYTALYRQKLDGVSAPELVLEQSDVDVEGLIRIGRQARVVGAAYASEKTQAVYFDPELDALTDGLKAALPGDLSIGVGGASADENRLLITASSDTNPGMLYLYDKTSRQLNELMPLRDGLEGRPMGKMTPMSFPASDGTEIPGYLTLPPGKENAKGLPAIVMPHGGPSSRDYWGFDWLVQFFAARGYAVLQPNYRGSTGYGAAWFGKNGFQAWRTAVGDVNDAGRWLVSQGIADPGKLAVIGWSYGGYAALQSQVLDPTLYKAVAAIAPVTDLKRLRDESRNFSSYELVAGFIGEGPHVAAGSPARNAAAFQAPVMLVHGSSDLNVDVKQSREMEDALQDAGKSVQYIEFDKLDHYIDDSTARTRMLSSIDAFLSRSLAP